MNILIYVVMFFICIFCILICPMYFMYIEEKYDKFKYKLTIGTGVYKVYDEVLYDICTITRIRDYDDEYYTLLDMYGNIEILTGKEIMSNWKLVEDHNTIDNCKLSDKSKEQLISDAKYMCCYDGVSDNTYKILHNETKYKLLI